MLAYQAAFVYVCDKEIERIVFIFFVFYHSALVYYAVHLVSGEWMLMKCSYKLQMEWWIVGMSQSQGELGRKESRGMSAVNLLLRYSSLSIDLTPPKR